MTASPFISICIPSYKRIDYLKRLLDSIAIQKFTNYEVVITDDSPDDTVSDFIKSYTGISNIYHFRNLTALGTPENWNEAIRQSKGEWIKMMHDDDWFTNENVLTQFYNTVNSNPDCSFFFSAFKNIDSESNYTEVVHCSWFNLLMLRINPLHLFKKVYIGNPSCTLIKREIDLFYDKRYKFVVDFEYYIRCIKKKHKWHYINEVLVNVGFNPEQVTKYTFQVASVQIPENHLLLNEMGAGILKNYFVYDYYWRMYRNLGIRNIAEIENHYVGKIPSAIKHMINFQKLIPAKLLRIGFISKIFMTINFLINLLRFE